MTNRWGKVETVTDFIFLSTKITADGDCSQEIKRRLLLGRKAKTNLKFNVLRAKSLQSCLTHDTMDWTLPGSSVHGIL